MSFPGDCEALPLLPLGSEAKEVRRVAAHRGEAGRRPCIADPVRVLPDLLVRGPGVLRVALSVYIVLDIQRVLSVRVGMCISIQCVGVGVGGRSVLTRVFRNIAAVTVYGVVWRCCVRCILQHHICWRHRTGASSGRGMAQHQRYAATPSAQRRPAYGRGQNASPPGPKGPVPAQAPHRHSRNLELDCPDPSHASST